MTAFAAIYAGITFVVGCAVGGWLAWRDHLARRFVGPTLVFFIACLIAYRMFAAFSQAHVQPFGERLEAALASTPESLIGLVIISVFYVAWRVAFSLLPERGVVEFIRGPVHFTSKKRVQALWFLNISYPVEVRVQGNTNSVWLKGLNGGGVSSRKRRGICPRRFLARLTSLIPCGDNLGAWHDSLPRICSGLLPLLASCGRGLDASGCRRSQGVRPLRVYSAALANCERDGGGGVISLTGSQFAYPPPSSRRRPGPSQASAMLSGLADNDHCALTAYHAAEAAQFAILVTRQLVWVPACALMTGLRDLCVSLTASLRRA